MSKPERGSLTTLLAKKPLGQGAPAAVSLEQAESAILTDVQTAVRTSGPADLRTNAGATADGGANPSPPVHTSVRTDAQPDVPPTSLLQRDRRRTLRVPWTFKLPFPLREELEAVAKFNSLNMTEIAVEAIERHLKHFPHPPAGPIK
jgi:hypothetical protein